MSEEVDLTEFTTVQASRKPVRCHVELTRQDLSPAKRAKFVAALENLTIQSSVIAEVLRRWGTPIGQESLQRHRRGDCGCGSKS
jgi:hypothetical protein